MSEAILSREGATRSVCVPSDLYRAVWRWHLYAGSPDLPIFITRAITGAFYLFRDELDAIIHADLERDDVQESISEASHSAMVDAALKTMPETAIKFSGPASISSSAEITINTPETRRIEIYVDPYTGNGLAALPCCGTVMWIIRYLECIQYLGSYTRMAIEIASGLAKQIIRVLACVSSIFQVVWASLVGMPFVDWVYTRSRDRARINEKVRT